MKVVLMCHPPPPWRSFAKQRAAIERDYGQVSALVYSCPELVVLLEPVRCFDGKISAPIDWFSQRSRRAAYVLPALMAFVSNLMTSVRRGRHQDHIVLLCWPHHTEQNTHFPKYNSIILQSCHCYGQPSFYDGVWHKQSHCARLPNQK